MNATARPVRSTTASWGGPERERGQAAVELALTLPLIALLLVFGVEVGVIVRDQLIAVQIAREAARHASVGEPYAPPEGAEVTISRAGGTIRAHTIVTHRLMTPGLTRAGPIRLEAEAVMRIEDG